MMTKEERETFIHELFSEDEDDIEIEDTNEYYEDGRIKEPFDDYMDEEAEANLPPHKQTYKEFVDEQLELEKKLK